MQQILFSLSLSDAKICLGDDPFKFDIGNVNLHPTKGAHWVAYLNEFFLFLWLFSSSKTI